MFILKKVTKSYENHLIIDNLFYTFNKDKYCLFGPNGSGKSTLLMLMSGIENFDSGSITFNEQTVNSIDVKRKIGVSSDKILLPDFLTPQQLLEFHCAEQQCVFPTEFITSLNFTHQLSTKVSQLSLGNLKKTSLLLALAHNPLCLILDEPTTGLEHQSRVWLLDYLDQYQGQVIVASHEENFLSNSEYHQINLLELNAKQTC